VQFFGIGPLELLMVLLVALLGLGPQRLPEVAVQLARALRALRRYVATMTAEFRREFREAYEEIEEMRAELRELRQMLREQATYMEQELAEAARQAEASLPRQHIIETSADLLSKEQPPEAHLP